MPAQPAPWHFGSMPVQHVAVDAAALEGSALLINVTNCTATRGEPLSTASIALGWALVFGMIISFLPQMVKIVRLRDGLTGLLGRPSGRCSSPGVDSRP